MPLFVAMFFGAGLMEELMKAVPILFGAWLAARAIKDPSKAQGTFYNLLHVRGPLDGALMGVFAGGGFIFIETAFQYVPNMVATIYRSSNDLGAAMTGALLLLLPRVFGGIVGHMAYSGIFGYFIGLPVIRPKAEMAAARHRLSQRRPHPHLVEQRRHRSPSLLQYVIAGVAAVGLVGADPEGAPAGGEPVRHERRDDGLDRRRAPRRAPRRGDADGPGDGADATAGGRSAPPVQPMRRPRRPLPRNGDATARNGATTAGCVGRRRAAEVLMLNIDGMMLPLRAGGRLDLAAEPALGGRGAGIVGAIIPHPTRANVLGLKNEGTAGWRAKLRDGSMQTIEREQSIRLAAGVEITFADGLNGAVVKIG